MERAESFDIQLRYKNNFEQGGIVPLTAGAIATTVEQIASPVTGICPRSENLKFYVNYVPYNLLLVKVRSTGLVNNTR